MSLARQLAGELMELEELRAERETLLAENRELRRQSARDSELMREGERIRERYKLAVVLHGTTAQIRWLANSLKELDPAPESPRVGPS